MNSIPLHAWMRSPSSPALIVGTPAKVFWKDFYFFTLIQVLIWIKVCAFLFIYGHGISYFAQPVVLNLPFVTLPLFSNWVQVADYAFHQVMHVCIALWVFLLAKHMKDFHFPSVAKLFFVAAIMHNVGYWVTRSHPSLIYSIRDYLTDFVALWMFFFIFLLVLRLVPFLRTLKIPFLERHYHTLRVE